MLMLMAGIRCVCVFFFVGFRCACHIKCKDRFVLKQSESMDYGLAYHMLNVYLCNKSFILLTQKIFSVHQHQQSATTPAIITELALI